MLAVPAYRQGRVLTQPGYKLSSNETPFDPPQEVLDAIAARPDIHLYPDPSFKQLRAKLADQYGGHVTSEYVQIAAGSVSLLYQLIHATTGVSENYIYPWPSFEAYPLLGVSSGATGVAVPLTDEAKHDFTAILEAVNEQSRAIILCTPNNPTGPVITAAEFADFMTRVPQDLLVILDEAYCEYVTDDAAVHGTSELLQQHPNLVILRTFSKAYGLAGLRIGYGVAAPELWQAVFAAAIPLAVNAAAENAALAVLSEPVHSKIKAQNHSTILLREQLIAGLQALGFQPPQAQGNFVWLPQQQLQQLTAYRPSGSESTSDISILCAEALADAGIIVRPFANAGVRITVGTEQSIKSVLQALQEFIETGRCKPVVL